MSYHLWRTFKSANGEEPRFLFLAYNVFVWVPTAVLPGGTVLCIYFKLTTIGNLKKVDKQVLKIIFSTF